VHYTLVDSPLGDIVIFGNDGTVSGLEFADSARATRPEPELARDDAAFGKVAEQLQAYFAGELTHFDVQIETGGTPFQRRVWQALLGIPYGATTTYGKLAAELGDPRAMRAVGLANGRNPISIIVPCHRVVGADGSLTGYGGGLPRKQWLLAHERGEAPLAW
jgi:methylated-DNA-[protein]-cysteine S-methyltransferase